MEILNCRHGAMLVFREDEVIGRSLRLYGEWAEHELSHLLPYLRPGTTVIDVGANIGTHTLAFARSVPDGRVIAIEPQPDVMSVLKVNCLLNGLSNVDVVNAVCAGARGGAAMHAQDARNPGATVFKTDLRLLTRICRLFNPQASHLQVQIPVVPIDDLATARPVSLIKVDAEGMELEVLRGARKVIAADRPAIFCEQNDTRQLAAIHDLLGGFNYRLYWLETHQFNKANFRSEQHNIWWRTETGILAIHGTFELHDGLIEVDRDALEIPTRYDAREGLLVNGNKQENSQRYVEQGNA